jgi:hypothetical protein
MHPRSKNIVCVIMLVAALTVLSSPAQVWGLVSGTVNIRISDDENDAEEYISTGSVDLGSTDLELGYEGGNAQIVGIRFPNVQIPRGATITNAYIQFYCDEETSGAATFNIKGEYRVLSEPFSTSDHNLSSRERTTAGVTWSGVPDWNQAHDAHQTPDISAIVQEIIERDFPLKWNSGNPMTFLITGSGTRTAESHNGTSSEAPLLHIEYTSDAVERRVSGGDNDAEEEPSGWVYMNSTDLEMVRDGSDDQFVGIRFQDIEVPQGALITNAYITFMVDETDSEATNLIIYGEASDDANAFVSTDWNISERARTGQEVQWNNVPAWDTVGDLYSTPDLSAIVQEIVGRAGWQSGNDMAFIIRGSGVRTAESYDGMPGGAPLLHIEFGAGANTAYINVSDTNLGASCYVGENALAKTFKLTNSGSAFLNYTISVDQTWVSLYGPGGTFLAPGASVDYSVGFNTAGFVPGTYEATITIADGAAFNSPVEIQVSVTVFDLEESPTCGNVPLYTENLTSPAILILLDISSSMGTKMDVATNEKQPTPSLKDIVQEIISRSGWNPGQSMAFSLTCTNGERIAKSFEGDSGYAPLLHVKYNDGSDHTIDIRITQGSDDAEEDQNGTMSLTNNDLSLAQDNTLGLRFRNVPIPRNEPPGSVDISEAYIEFTVDETDTKNTDVVIKGEAFDDPPTYANEAHNITNRYETAAQVAWNDLEDWTGTTQERRVDIGKSVISDLVKDRSISWGYGTWCNKPPWKDQSDGSYTIIHVGTKPHTDEHQQALQDAIAATERQSGTPFSPSILGAKYYFSGTKADDAGDFYVKSDCQPKFLIDVTDGMGNTGSSVSNVGTRTRDLADMGVSTAAVGFGLEYNQAEQIYEMAKVANEEGREDPFDEVYALHEESGGVGQPYFAFDKQQLMDNLKAITENIKGEIFYGSAPAPTTSLDLGDTVIVAKFDASRWTGELQAISKDMNTSSTTYGQWVEEIWAASEQMPATRSLWTASPFIPGFVIPYSDAVLANDNYDCNATKPIGDIINSTPVVVGTPPYYYPFDNYWDFVTQMTRTAPRDTMIYIGANDGALHAFDLVTGEERWSFFPQSLHAKMNKAKTDPLYDRCSPEYCHQYYVDGSPQVGDVYAEFNGTTEEWRTVLVVGEREGGEAYFALDVTSGQDFNNANSDPAQFLWEFTDNELGQTWGDPSINRVAVAGSATETAWGVFFGSGYSATQQNSKEAYMYGILAHDAGDLWKDSQGNATNRIKMGVETDWLAKVKNYLQTDFSKHFAVGEMVEGASSHATAKVVAVQWTSVDQADITLSDLTGTFIADEQIVGQSNPDHQADLDGSPSEKIAGLPNDAMASPLLVDLEGNYIADRIYAGDLYGNLYRIINIGKNQVPAVSTLLTFDHSLSGINPIRGKAGFAYGEGNGNIWVYCGTGKYEIQADKTNTATQYFFGLQDSAAGVSTYAPDDPRIKTIQAKFLTTQINGQDRTVRIYDGSNPYHDSWKIELYSGQFSGPSAAGSERVFTKPLVVNGIVFFTTFIPDQNVCAGSGETWVFAVQYDTGLPPSFPIFDLNGDGLFDDKDKVEVNGEKLIPMGIFVGRGKGSHPVLHKDTLFITTTGDGDDSVNGKGGLTPIPFNNRNSRVRVNSWKQN